jgi:hypothetical protein
VGSAGAPGVPDGPAETSPPENEGSTRQAPGDNRRPSMHRPLPPKAFVFRNPFDDDQPKKEDEATND